MYGTLPSQEKGYIGVSHEMALSRLNEFKTKLMQGDYSSGAKNSSEFGIASDFYDLWVTSLQTSEMDAGELVDMHVRFQELQKLAEHAPRENALVSLLKGHQKYHLYRTQFLENVKECIRLVEKKMEKFR